MKYAGRRELEVGFWRVKFKVGKDGAIHNLPYSTPKISYI